MSNIYDINGYTHKNPNTIKIQTNFSLNIFTFPLPICLFLYFITNTQCLTLDSDYKGFFSAFVDHVFSRHFYFGIIVFISDVFLTHVGHCFTIVLYIFVCFPMWSWNFGIFVSMSKTFCSFTFWWILWFCMWVLVCYYYCSYDKTLNKWNRARGRGSYFSLWIQSIIGRRQDRSSC